MRLVDELRRIWLAYRLRRAERQLRAHSRRSAQANPVKTRLLELGIQADDHGIETLTARQQLVVRTSTARGIIGNGGFRYFLQHSDSLRPVAEGFRELGFVDAAEACKRVIAVVAAQPQLTDQARREAIVGSRDEAFGFDEEDSAVFAVDWSALEAAIGDYMRRYPHDFPAIR